MCYAVRHVRGAGAELSRITAGDPVLQEIYREDGKVKSKALPVWALAGAGRVSHSALAGARVLKEGTSHLKSEELAEVTR